MAVLLAQPNESHVAALQQTVANIKGESKGATQTSGITTQSNGTTQSIHLSATPDFTANGTLPVFVADGDDQYEYIRVPKAREYDLFCAPRPSLESRNTAELPLTALKPDGKTKVTLWAAMDTGSIINAIHETTLDALLGRDLAHKRRREMTSEQFELIGDCAFTPRYSVDLDFKAGKSEHEFTKVNFIVVPGMDVMKANSDGVPNVLLGCPFLREHSVVMIDDEYCNEPDGDIEVIADRAEREREGMGGIFEICKGTKKPGVKR